MGEFDDDIQADLDNGNIFALSLVAQDLRDTLKHVNYRSLNAAYKRKRKEHEEKES